LLSSWFVNNYIRECSQLCPHNVSRLFDDVSTIWKLQNAVSAIVDWRLNTPTMKDYFLVFLRMVQHITNFLSRRPLTVWSLNWWLTEFTKLSPSISEYIVSVTFLHIAHRMSRDCLTDELMDVLAAVVGMFTGSGRYSIRRSSGLLLNQVAQRMNVAGDKSQTTVQLIEIELCKAYLYRALRCEDSDSDSIYCLANVYLAVLYYTTGHFQTAIDHCTLVTNSQDHSHVVQGELLPKVDDDVDIVLGLAAFYQHVRTAALNQQQTQHVTVFTTELFARYLRMKCLSVVQCQLYPDSSV